MSFKFVYICDLFERLEDLEAKDVPLLPNIKAAKKRDIVTTWFRQHRQLIDDPNTDRVALLSTLFPERRTDRVYGLQEPKLKGVLGRCLQLDSERRKALNMPGEDLATRVALMQRAREAGMRSYITVEEVDSILERIASQGRFSGPEVRAKAARVYNQPVHSILEPLVNRSSSVELKWLVRLILKRLSPVVLDENLVLRSFHFLLPELLKFQSTFDSAIQLLAMPPISDLLPSHIGRLEPAIQQEITEKCLRPRVGVKVGRPNYIKGRSIQSCYNLVKSGKWAIEPKYDGEYCQVHIDLSKGRDCIQLFSKSGKDSTKDRANLHAWLKDSLKIGQPYCRFKEKCIVEGEMVVFDATTNDVLEFWKIRRQVKRSGVALGTEVDSQPHPDERLGLVYYDALLIDDEIVMSKPYEQRRRLLDQLVRPNCSGYAGLEQGNERDIVDFRHICQAKGVKKLEQAFAKAIARRTEGLVLRPCNGPYFAIGEQSLGSFDGQLIKLKKDYIPGLGDTADFAIVGATFDPLNAGNAELSRLKYNTLALGCLVNKQDVVRFSERPVFRLMCNIGSPCVPVDVLQLVCEVVAYTPPVPGPTFELVSDACDRKPDVLLESPIVAELLGGGFERPSSKSIYMLRNPRILKIHDDRSVEEVVSFFELQEMANQAIMLPENARKEEREWFDKLKKSTKTKNMPYFGEESCSSAGSSPEFVLKRESVNGRSFAAKICVDLCERFDVEIVNDAKQRPGKTGSRHGPSNLTAPPPSNPSNETERRTTEPSETVSGVINKSLKHKMIEIIDLEEEPTQSDPIQDSIKHRRGSELGTTRAKASRGNSRLGASPARAPLAHITNPSASLSASSHTHICIRHTKSVRSSNRLRVSDSFDSAISSTSDDAEQSIPRWPSGWKNYIDLAWPDDSLPDVDETP